MTRRQKAAVALYNLLGMEDDDFEEVNSFDEIPDEERAFSDRLAANLLDLWDALNP